MSIRQIARTLGLSPSAVSLALRSSGKVSPATRERVRREANRVGYAPDARVTELMAHLRRRERGEPVACLGVVSLYDRLRPWEGSLHLGRIHESMTSRARELGYRLESLPLCGAGMSPKRLAGILETRGIRGLLCFGSQIPGVEFPAELRSFSVVSIGLSVAGPLHRVASHLYNDLSRTLDQVWSRGYRRPGLILGEREEARSGRAYSSAYFGWCERHLGTPEPLPLFRTRDLSSSSLDAWLGKHQPDVLVYVDVTEALPILERFLAGRRAGTLPPLVVVTQVLSHTKLPGMEQNQELMGRRAVDLLASVICPPGDAKSAEPRLELVDGRWHEGTGAGLPAVRTSD